MHQEKIPLTEINKLPNLPGVYFFYDEKDQLRYIGKSNHIKKRVLQHFAGKDRKSLKIQQFIKTIGYEPMGSELIALLHESDLIKQYQPLYNRSQRRTLFQYGLYTHLVNGYIGLTVQKIQKDKEEITTFSSLGEGKEALFRITEKYQLCQKINGLYKTNGPCFQYQIKQCLGACIQAEDTATYNTRVESFINPFTSHKITQLIEIPGRNEDEKGLVYIENGSYKGFGFCPIKTPAKKRLAYIEAKIANKDTKRILMRYLLQNNG
ncbi:GIY-YIG nuclease family protein [Sphingobacterium sp. MYb382]|uniref:GIY-YIG nuclease family protein n=1 Tax=Sphingobacterium sp. MYb382 TaxID=2745278 RepID=UPI0030A44B85